MHVSTLDMLSRQIPIWHISDWCPCWMSALVEIRKIVVNVFFSALELSEQTTLSVGKKCLVKQHSFPFKAAAPYQSLQTHIKPCARIDEQFHHGAPIIRVAVDGVEYWRVSANAVGINGRLGIHIRSRFDQRPSTLDRTIFRANVQSGHAAQGRKCAVQIKSSLHPEISRLHPTPQCDRIINQECPQNRVLDDGPVAQHHAQTSREPGRPQVFHTASACVVATTGYQHLDQPSRQLTVSTN